MKLAPLCLALLLLFYTPQVAGQDQVAEAIDRLLTDLYKKHIFNGAIVVGQNGKIRISKGYGYASFQDSVRFTPNSSSDGGSIAKTVTATAILLLAEEGKLRLTDPVQRYLPHYPYPNTTVWNLITHSTGGLPDYDYYFEKAPAEVDITNSLNLHLISRHKPALVYLTNTNFNYDNVGFDLAALILEQVTGITYEEFIKSRFFQFLEIDSSFIRPARLKSFPTGRTRGYRYQRDSLQQHDVADREGFYGGDNIWFTTTDLYRWGTSFYHRSPLSPALRQQVIAPVIIGGKPSYIRLGGWYPGRSNQAFYYWGNVAGFYSWVYWDQQKQFTIAFMTNTDMPHWARPLLTSALVSLMEGAKFVPVVEPRADTVERNNLQFISGTYQVAGVGRVQISVRQPAAFLRVNEGMEYRMYRVGSNIFYVPGIDPWLLFSVSGKNKFQQIHWYSTNVQTTGKRISD